MNKYTFGPHLECDSDKPNLRLKETGDVTALVDGTSSSSNERSLKGNHALNSMSSGKSVSSSVAITGASTPTTTTGIIPSVNSIRLGFMKHCNHKNQQQNTGVVSMHKFINSKGKKVTNSNLNRFASHQNLCFNSSTNDYSLHVIGSTGSANEHRGIIRASDTPIATMTPNFKAVRKGTTPAETKIQAEMREMKDREEELR
jgi:hypothetical protein